MDKVCGMCGVEKEIVGKAVYVWGEQLLCEECLSVSIPKYTVVYQKEKVDKESRHG